MARNRLPRTLSGAALGFIVGTTAAYAGLVALAWWGVDFTTDGPRYPMEDVAAFWLVVLASVPMGGLIIGAFMGWRTATAARR